MWTLDTATSVAKLELPGLTGSVDLCQPALGFRVESLQGLATNTFKSLLSIDFEIAHAVSGRLTPSEFFVRGTDLVATYPESDRKIRSQIYWRAIRATEGAPEFGLEVMVSVQTDLLNSDPGFKARSEFRGAQVGLLTAEQPPSIRALPLGSSAVVHELRPSPDALWVTWNGQRLAYVEVPTPGDSVATRVSNAPAAGESQPLVRIEHDLLHEFLEKGVIRRCRLRGVFLPAGGDDGTVACQVVERFRRSELPLTA